MMKKITFNLATRASHKLESRFKQGFLITSLSLVLAACGGSDDDDNSDALALEKMVLSEKIEILSDQIDSYNAVQSLTESVSIIRSQLSMLETSLETDDTTQVEINTANSTFAMVEQTFNQIIADNAATYEITVTNITHNQPLSPVAVILHEQGHAAWHIGSPASNGLEILAESGSPTQFVEDMLSASTMMTGDSPVGPGTKATFSLTTQWDTDLAVTLATMLVNTNDAFTGVTDKSIHTLAPGQTLDFFAPVYDAGTEVNDELATTIPGPAAGGEGVNIAREPANQVTRHPGVVTHDDGYAESALNQSHRFDSHPIKVSIHRAL